MNRYSFVLQALALSLLIVLVAVAPGAAQEVRVGSDAPLPEPGRASESTDRGATSTDSGVTVPVAPSPSPAPKPAGMTESSTGSAHLVGGSSAPSLMLDCDDDGICNRHCTSDPDCDLRCKPLWICETHQECWTRFAPFALCNIGGDNLCMC